MPHSCGKPNPLRRHILVSSQPDQPAHEEIAKLAYSYWEQRGCQGGSELEDWLRAERELMRRRARTAETVVYTQRRAS
jgi:hypothetical protein